MLEITAFGCELYYTLTNIVIIVIIISIYFCKTSSYINIYKYKYIVYIKLNNAAKKNNK